MKRLADDNGSASVAALVLLILMAAVAAGGALVLSGVLSYTSRSSEQELRRFTLHKEAERIVSLLVSDPTPEADSAMDPVWGGLGSETPGTNVTLQDVSSRLNANWVQKQLLQKTALGGLLQPSSTVEQLQQRREDRGLSTNIAAEYQDLIKEEALARYFTGYGYANLNTTDEFALRKLYAIRMDDPDGAEVFHTHWQQALIKRKMLKRSDLRDFLGLDFSKLYPLMNVEPAFNVHFIEPLLLTEILSFPELNIQQPRRAAQLILDARDHSELTAADVQRIVGAPGDNLVYQYLGVTTWFWKVTISHGVDSMESIVARVPSVDGASPRFLLVEERYFP